MKLVLRLGVPDQIIPHGDRKVMIHSVYHDEDNTFYQIVASPTTEADVPTTQKAIDSFIFVTR